MHPVNVNAATAANKVLRTRIDVLICVSPSGPSWRRASERRMNPFSVSQFSVARLLDGDGRSWGCGRALVASRAYRHGVANHRAAHAVLAYIGVLESRRRTAVAFELDPNLRFLFRRQRK